MKMYLYIRDKHVGERERERERERGNGNLRSEESSLKIFRKR